jgi:hypothetical protein
MTSEQFSDSHATKLQSHHLFTPLPIRSLLNYKGYQAAHNYMVRLSRPQRLSYDERVVIVRPSTPFSLPTNTITGQEAGSKAQRHAHRS